jgi:hypothetical protein
MATAKELLIDARSNIGLALEKMTTPPVIDPTRRVLAVPYSSQHEKDAKRFRLDCGAACVEMVGEFYAGQTPGVGTNEIHAWMTDGKNKTTSANDLNRALKHFHDVDATACYDVSPEHLRGFIDDGDPAIVLVRYGDFPLRMDLSYTAGHWMCVVGYDSFDWAGHEVRRLIMHDPDWYYQFMAQGGFLPVIEEMFVGMHSDYRRLALVAE